MDQAEKEDEMIYYNWKESKVTAQQVLAVGRKMPKSL